MKKKFTCLPDYQTCHYHKVNLINTRVWIGLWRRLVPWGLLLSSKNVPSKSTTISSFLFKTVMHLLHIPTRIHPVHSCSVVSLQWPAFKTLSPQLFDTFQAPCPLNDWLPCCVWNTHTCKFSEIWTALNWNAIQKNHETPTHVKTIVASQMPLKTMWAFSSWCLWHVQLVSELQVAYPEMACPVL